VEDRVVAAAAAAIKRADAEALFHPRIGPPAMIDGRALVDHASIFACHVPKPLCLQCGRRDKEMPPEHFQAIADQLARLYGLCNAEERLFIDVHGGGRILRQEHVSEFFERHL
jgi:dienelactone hydrolase